MGKITTETSIYTQYNYRVALPISLGIMFSVPVFIELVLGNYPPLNHVTIAGPAILASGIILLIYDGWLWKKKIEIRNYHKLDDGRILVVTADNSPRSDASRMIISNPKGKSLSL